MSFLTTALVGGIPSLALRAGAIALALGTLVGYGYTKGLHHQEAKDAAAFSKIRIEQDEQAVRAGRIALDRSVAIQSTVDTYEAQRRSVADYYAGKLRDASARGGSGTLSTSALPAGTAPGDVGRVPVACGDWQIKYIALEGKSERDFIALEERCAVTALKLKALREAVREVQNIN